MRFRKISKFSTSLIIIALASGAFASEYPQTRDEKIADEMGSIVGGEGIVFRPSHTKNEATKSSVSAEKKVNKFLWEAAREVLKIMPTLTCDKDNGIIITDWYTPKDNTEYSYKLEVTITDDVISTASLNVVAHEKKLKNKQWVNENESKALEYLTTEKILKQARKLYVESIESK